MPGGDHVLLSKTFIDVIEVDALPENELKDFLNALLCIDRKFTAHIRIKTGNDCILSENEIQLVITTIPNKEGKSKTIWGLELDMHLEGNGCCIKSFSLDYDLAKIAEKYHDEFRNNRKSLPEWKQYLTNTCFTLT